MKRSEVITKCINGDIHNYEKPLDDHMRKAGVVGYDQLSNFFHYWHGYREEEENNRIVNEIVEILKILGFKEFKDYEQLDDCYYILMEEHI